MRNDATFAQIIEILKSFYTEGESPKRCDPLKAFWNRVLQVSLFRCSFVRAVNVGVVRLINNPYLLSPI